METVNTCTCEPDCRAHEKACFVCGETKPRSEFYRHARMADGHLNKCKSCTKRQARRRHRHKIEHDAEWREKERERSRRKEARRRRVHGSRQHPHHDVHVELGNAIRDGRIVPATRCEDCGHDFSEFRREAHHDDYSKPLDVRWLCALCHGRRHRMEGEVST